MPIFIRFKYKNYPHSPKATQRSRALGICTCFTMSALMIFFACAFINAFFTLFLPEEPAFLISVIISIVGGILIRKKIVTHFEAKIEALAKADLLKTINNGQSSGFENQAPKQTAAQPVTHVSNNNNNNNSYTVPISNDELFISNNEMYIDL